MNRYESRGMTRNRYEPGGGLNPEPPRPLWAVGSWPLAPPPPGCGVVGGGGVGILKAVNIPIGISIL